MIRFIPIRFWKNISLALFLIGLMYTLVGTVCIDRVFTEQMECR